METKKKQTTENVNTVFSLIAQMTGILDKKETRQNNDELDLSGLVESIGVEPMTSCMPCKRSSQLS